MAINPNVPGSGSLNPGNMTAAPGGPNQIKTAIDTYSSAIDRRLARLKTDTSTTLASAGNPAMVGDDADPQGQGPIRPGYAGGS